MAFGRRKKREEGGERAAEAEPGQAGDESTAVVEDGGEQPADPGTEVRAAAGPEGRDTAPQDLGGPVGDELAQAGAEAGDSAAAGTGMEGAPADAADPYAPGALGTAAASPEHAARAEGDDFREGGAAPGGFGGEEPGHSLGERVEAIAQARPEVLVGAAFAGGLLLARALGAAGGDR
jgi:hypothetical protein